MKYLVTWHDRTTLFDLCTCRYFDNKEKALRLYNDFKDVPLFDNVKFIAISEKPAKNIIIDVKVVK